jgi:hypothetical protein
MSLRNYLCKWPDASVTILQACSREEAVEALDAIADPGKCKIHHFRGNLCFELSAPPPVRNKHTPSNYVLVPEKAVCCMQSAYLSELFSDVTLRVLGTDLPAHRVILCREGGFFSAMFSSAFRESRDPVCCIEPVYEGVTLADFKAFLFYLYTDELPPVTGAPPTSQPPPY